MSGENANATCRCYEERLTLLVMDVYWLAGLLEHGCKSPTEVLLKRWSDSAKAMMAEGVASRTGPSINGAKMVCLNLDSEGVAALRGHVVGELNRAFDILERMALPKSSHVAGEDGATS